MTDTERIVSVVGTTSGGKSTLLNALIGQWLLPTGVQETTRIVTRIVQHYQPRQWTVARAGRTMHFSDEASVRLAVRAEAVGAEEITIAAPARASNSMQLRFVTARFMRRRAGLALQDLPGIVSQSDNEHLAIYHRVLRESHVVVAVVNATETNEVKTQELIDLVADGALFGGSRCVWVLGRVDECLKDEDDRETRVSRRLALAETIQAAYGEPARVHAISARAALLASLVIRSASLRPGDIEVIQRWLACDVAALAPDLRLPRTPLLEWSDTLRFRVAWRLWRASGMSRLDQALDAALR